MLCALDHSDSDVIRRPFLTVESAGFVAEWLARIVSCLVGRCRRRFGQDLHFPGTSLRSSSSPLNALEDRECFHRGYVRRRDGEKIWGATSVTKVRDSVFAEDTEDDDLYSVVFSEFLVDCIQRNFLPILEVM